MASPTEQLRAAPALLPPLARPPSPGCSPEVAAERSAQLDALRECLRAEQARAAAELERLAEQQAAVQAAIQEGCAAAEEQHGNIVDALGSLATRLAALAPDHGSTCSTAAGQHPPGAAPSTGRAPPLLSTDLPDAYARACTALLEALGEYVQHHLPGDGGSSAASGSGSGAGLPAAQAHRRRELELAQLQGCQCKSERLRVAEEAEVARLQAELEVLRAPAGAPPAAASLGYTPSNLQAEVASLRRQQAARLAQAQDAAEAAAAAAAGAGVAEEQAQQRHAVLEARLQAKQQAAAMLARHLARQLLVLQLLQHEQAAVQNAQTVVAAARADAEMALQAALGRLASYDAQQQQRQQHAATPGTASSSTDEELATAEQLLACRAELQRLLGDVQASTLPGLHAAYSQLHGLLFGSGSSGDDGSNPAASEQQQQHGELELSLPAVREQLAAVAEAHAALNLQANALISEVYERQSVASSRPDSERALAERVLLEFWTAPQRLAARAAEQQRKLATYAA